MNTVNLIRNLVITELSISTLVNVSVFLQQTSLRRLLVLLIAVEVGANINVDFLLEVLSLHELSVILYVANRWLLGHSHVASQIFVHDTAHNATRHLLYSLLTGLFHAEFASSFPLCR